MATATLNTLAPKTRVVATVDMKGVPRGTTGKVIFVQGLSWIRYWVLFDNGMRVGTLDRSKLATLADWENKAGDSTEVVTVGAGGVAAASSAGDAGAGAGESIGGVPAHLLEKSKAARARWAAKKAG
jgi:hypothetical protein